jgi:DsbC/DsbD-like thiol-disulfide interchange protein
MLRFRDNKTRFSPVLSAVLTMGALFFQFLPGSGQTLNGVTLVKASIVSESNDASKPFTVGLRLRMENGWHLYWKNPGDAGLPIDVAWSLPPGYKALPLQHPVPVKKLSDDATCYMYEHDVMLLATIVPPERGKQKRISIGAKLGWLACKERCVLGSDSISLAIGSMSATTIAENRALIAAWSKKLPQPLRDAGVTMGVPSVRQTADSIIVTLRFTGTGAKDITDFFPESDESFVLNHAAVRVRDLTVTLPYLKAEHTARLRGVRGLVMKGAVGYDAVLGF